MLADFLKQLELQVHQNKLASLDLTNINYPILCSHHDSPISHIRVLGNGNVLTLDAKGIIRIWNVDKEVCVETIAAPTQATPPPNTKSVSFGGYHICDMANGNIVVVYLMNYSTYVYSREGTREEYANKESIRIMSVNSGAILYECGYLDTRDLSGYGVKVFSNGIFMNQRLDIYRDDDGREKSRYQTGIFLDSNGKTLAGFNSSTQHSSTETERAPHWTSSDKKLVGFCPNGNSIYLSRCRGYYTINEYYAGDRTTRTEPMSSLSITVTNKDVKQELEEELIKKVGGYNEIDAKVKYLSDGSILVSVNYQGFYHSQSYNRGYGDWSSSTLTVREKVDKIILFNDKATYFL